MIKGEIKILSFLSLKTKLFYFLGLNTVALLFGDHLNN